MVGDERSDQDREVQSDEISRRMDKVIDRVEAVHSETVTPHWEVFDDPSGRPSIYHLHNGQKVDASIREGDGGAWTAECSQGDGTLQLAPAGADRRA
jgi:hypothetical protein